MGAVNRFAQGLLGLLQTKSLGRLPSEASDLLQLTVDATPFYMAGLSMVAARATQTVGASFIGQGALLEVPAGETWAVIAIDSRFNHDTGGEFSRVVPEIAQIPFSPTASDVSTPLNVALSPYHMLDTELALGVATDEGAGILFPQPLIVRAPVIFASRVCEIVTASSNVLSTTVAYYQLD